MNFDWRETTSEDIETFNNWHKAAKLASNSNDKISIFLSDYPLLGKFIDNTVSAFPERLRALTAVYKNMPVGVTVVYLRNNKELDNVATFEIIAVNPKFHGLGIGTAMIFDVVKNSDKILGTLPEYFFACVDKDNISSKTAFEHNNFSTDGNIHMDYLSYFLNKCDYDLLKDNCNPKFKQVFDEILLQAEKTKQIIKKKK